MSWIRYWTPPDDARMWLVCLPAGGAGAQEFQPWAARLPRQLGVAAVELPGRGSRARETPARHLDDVVGPLVQAMAPLLDRPMVLFGHSMGAVLAVELADALRRSRGWRPATLVAAACEAPRHYRMPLEAATAPEADVLAQVVAWGGTPPDLLADPEYRPLLLDLIRADLALAASWQPDPVPHLGCPVYAYLGAGDPEVGAAEAHGWAEVGDGRQMTRTFPGGHFFVRESLDEMLAQLVADINSTLGIRLPAPTAGAGRGA